MDLLAGLKQELEIRVEEGKEVGQLDNIIYYIESLEHTLRRIEITVATNVNPIDAMTVLAPIRLQKKRMNEWYYGTWSPGPDGKRPMTGILELKE